MICCADDTFVSSDSWFERKNLFFLSFFHCINKYFLIFQAMCSVRAESCCSIWLNCLSGSMQTDNCLDPPAHKLESTRLFPWGSHFSLVGNLSRKWFGFLSLGIIVVYGRSPSYYSVAHQLPGPSWQTLHLRCIPRFWWKNFPIKTSGDIESRAPSVTIWNMK